MKELMKIIGVKLVHQSNPEDGIVELTLIPYETIKKKSPGLMELATGGFEKMIQEAQSSIKHETKIYMNLIEWIQKYKNQPLSNVWVEITLDQTAYEIGTGKKEK